MKSSLLVIRIEPDQKDLIQRAASKRSQSISTFVVSAALSAAKREEKRVTQTQQVPRAFFRGVPTFFKALCFEASQGGHSTYADAGYGFAGAIPGQIEYDSDAELVSKWNALDRLMCAKDNMGILEWLEQEFPRCIALVPARRRLTFLQGMYQAHEEGRMDL